MGRPKKKKPVETPKQDVPILPENDSVFHRGFPQKVVDEALRVGFTDQQIDSFRDRAGNPIPTALKDAIYQLDPVARIRLDEESQPVKPPQPMPVKTEPVEKTVTFSVSVAEWMTTSANHAAMEEMQIQSELRARRIRNIQSLSIVRPYIPDKRGQLVSQVTINYKEKA